MDTHIWWLPPVQSSSWEDCTQHSSWLRRIYNCAGGVRDLQSSHIDSARPTVCVCSHECRRTPRRSPAATDRDLGRRVITVACRRITTSLWFAAVGAGALSERCASPWCRVRGRGAVGNGARRLGTQNCFCLHCPTARVAALTHRAACACCASQPPHAVVPAAVVALPVTQ